MKAPVVSISSQYQYRGGIPRYCDIRFSSYCPALLNLGRQLQLDMWPITRGLTLVPPAHAPLSPGAPCRDAHAQRIKALIRQQWDCSPLHTSGGTVVETTSSLNRSRRQSKNRLTSHGKGCICPAAIWWLHLSVSCANLEHTHHCYKTVHCYVSVYDRSCHLGVPHVKEKKTSGYVADSLCWCCIAVRREFDLAHFLMMQTFSPPSLSQEAVHTASGWKMSK